MKKKTAVAEARLHVFYSGHVQGVGFRYTAQRLALDLGLTGWVKNLPDDRVELVGEGSREKLERLLEDIHKSALGPKIRKASPSWEPPTNEFSDFSIEFYL